MLRIANGTADLATIESLCLLSYSFFLGTQVSLRISPFPGANWFTDADFHLGQFHLGLAIQLCRSARMDLLLTYDDYDILTERKARVFWSLQIMEQSYGQQSGMLHISPDTWCPPYVSNREFYYFRKQSNTNQPPFPSRGMNSPDIWEFTLHMGWIWSRVRLYTANIAQHHLKEPWRHDSAYAIILSDLMEVETRMPMCHRYDSVKFYQRGSEEVCSDQNYWKPWLKLQFTYHLIHTVMNHPFLYVAASQKNSDLAIPNTFWKKSTELVLSHATWIIRMVDMVLEKQVQLQDPSFAHAAAVAATVHLYYCCAVDSRLRTKSRADMTKCRRFLAKFKSCHRICEVLVSFGHSS